jgi:hypothetical protein
MSIDSVNRSGGASAANNQVSRVQESIRSTQLADGASIQQPSPTVETARNLNPSIEKNSFEVAAQEAVARNLQPAQGLQRIATPEAEAITPMTTTRTADAARPRALDSVPIPQPRPEGLGAPRSEDTGEVGEVEETAPAVGSTEAAPSAGDPTGILSGMTPSGASAATARQDRIPSGGVEASQQMAETDRARVMAHKEVFEELGEKYGIPPAVLAAIASRETRGGAALNSDGYGRYDPNGFGLMQVDKNNHTIEGAHSPTSREHLEQATQILADFHDRIKAAHPDWTPEQHLQAAIAAYNKGPSSAIRASEVPENFDRGTTGGDYSNDVIARAQYYAERW